VRYDPGAMAGAWRAECPACHWIAFADLREQIDRLVRDHVDGPPKQNHVVTIEPGPRGRPDRVT